MILHEGGVILHTLDDGAVIDEDIASRIIEDTRTIAEGEPVAVIVDLRAIAYASPASREMFAQNPSGGIEVATALVAGSQAAGHLLTTHFVTRDKPDRPTAVFSNIDEAAGWAAQQVAESQADH
jgi:hypothetical protein